MDLCKGSSVRSATGKIIKRTLPAVTGACFWLAIGLAITVLVSWYLAAFLPQSRWKVVDFDDDRALERDPPSLVELNEYTAIGAVCRVWFVWWMGGGIVPRDNDPGVTFEINEPVDHRRVREGEGFGFPHWGYAEGVFVDPGRFGNGCEQATGWPLPALWYGIGPFRYDESPRVQGGIQIAGGPIREWNVSKVRALPLRPIWAGLAINSPVYALIAWGCLRGRILARRIFRRRRGLCPFCGYDLRHDLAGGCPECGWNREAVK